MHDEQLLLTMLGRTIRLRRRALGLTLVDLGDKAGVSFRYIGDIERGNRAIGIITLFRLADALDTSAGDLLTLVEVSAVIAKHVRSGGASHTVPLAENYAWFAWARTEIGVGVLRAPITRGVWEHQA